MKDVNIRASLARTKRFFMRTVLREHTDQVQILRERGGALVAQGRIQEALDCRRKAVELAPDNFQLRLDLISDAAAADARYLHEYCSSDFAPALYHFAQARASEGKLDIAVECLRLALKVEPSFAKPYQDLVGLLLAKGQPGEAKEISANLDPTKLPHSFERRYYKDFTAEEKCTLLEAGSVTIATPEAIVELIRGVGHVLRNNIPGAFVECGVFMGGNAVVMIRTLINARVTDRDIYLYDTFDGFPKPQEVDFEYFVGPALETWKKFKQLDDELEAGSDWLRYPIEKVQQRVLALDYPAERIHFVKGLVEDTIPARAPEKIALLKLDTDFYRSTKHEFIHLYPRLQRGGILIIDDYGALQGSRTATDEYLRENDIPFFPARIDEHVRIGIKP